MTIDKKVFTREMTLLHERHGRHPSGPVIQRYYDSLKDRLTTEEFEAAARYVFDHDAYWPAPVRFIEVAHGDDRQHASSAWEHVLKMASKGFGVSPASDEDPLKPALQAAGGITSIARCESEWSLDQKRKAFMAAWSEATRRRRIDSLRLPAPEDE